EVSDSKGPAMNHRTLAAAIALLLLIPASVADAQARVTYSPEWLAVVEAEPAFAPAGPLFEAGDGAAVRELVSLTRGDQRLVARLAALAEQHDLTGPLVDGLD